MTAPIICACGHRASRHYAGKCRAALGCECPLCADTYAGKRDLGCECPLCADGGGFEQALREKIALEIEAKYLGPDSGRGYDGREAPDAALRNAYDEGLESAARIARGGAR